jgi:broad specificity phosphatase PhoE
LLTRYRDLGFNSPLTSHGVLQARQLGAYLEAHRSPRYQCPLIFQALGRWLGTWL